MQPSWGRLNDRDPHMLPAPKIPRVATHWGTYQAGNDGAGRLKLMPVPEDPSPSPFWTGVEPSFDGPCRVRTPMVRSSYLEKTFRAGGSGRGREPFVSVGWDVALDLVSTELDRVRRVHGNAAIFGGSYGWSSAGRFHHAQSQIHRFLNTIGGYTASVDSYSYGAAEVILPHVIGGTEGLDRSHTSWRDITDNTQLVVAFGGMPAKNTQANAGGLSRHRFSQNLAHAVEAGVEFVLVGPIRSDLAVDGVDWIPLRPTTDTALMLALGYVLVTENLHDRAFLDRYTVGFDRFAAYLIGQTDGTAKSPAWAAEICSVPEAAIVDLARRMARSRTLLTMAWSVQRAEHGEQPYWMLVTLAAMLGQIGLPGAGFGFGYGAVNGIGDYAAPFDWPSLPQGRNPVDSFIPVSRIADALLSPGGEYAYNGERRRFPDLKLLYWAGGNPFHHHQDLNRLVQAWLRPETIIVHDAWWTGAARHADIVLPCTIPPERNDLVCARRDRVLVASSRLREPAGSARDDFGIFADLAGRLGDRSAFDEGCDEEAWLRRLYAVARQRAAAVEMELPDFHAFWQEGWVDLVEKPEMPPLMSAFRRDPDQHRLITPSGRIEIFSATIEAFGLASQPGHPVWNEPVEWLGGERATVFPLQLLSNQPSTKLHSQYDHAPNSRDAKVNGREIIRIHPADARARGIAERDIVRVYNDRGAFLAAAILSTDLVPGVLQIATGAWFDPLEPGVPGSLEKHGNPNVVTSDRGTSDLAQACTANSCLVDIVRFTGDLPAITCYEPPEIVGPL